MRSSRLVFCSLIGIVCLSVGCKEPAQSTSPSETASASAAETPPTYASGLPWTFNLSKAREQARAANKPLFIDFGAEWCAPCMELEEKTFSDPTLNKVLRDRFILLKVDASKMQEEPLALMKRFNAETLPVILTLDPKGKEVLRITEFIAAQNLLEALAPLSADPN